MNEAEARLYRIHTVLHANGYIRREQFLREEIPGPTVGAGHARDPDPNAHSPGNHALRRGRASMPHQAYLVTSATNGRQCFFSSFKAGCAAARCFIDREILGDASLLAWVLMPDHAHWLLQLGERDALDRLVNRVKSASARHANRILNRRGALWQAAYHDHALRSHEDFRTAARYVIANPLRAGLVERLADYPFWDAVWL
ncbi:REP-associated tyrosine transposase [Methylolobus aquaticus]